MNCRLCQDLLPEYLLDELSADSSSDVHQHLDSGCPNCNQELASIQLAMERLVDSMELVAAPHSTWSAVAAAIDSDGLAIEAAAKTNGSVRSADSAEQPRHKTSLANKNGRWIDGLAASLAMAAGFAVVMVGSQLIRPNYSYQDAFVIASDDQAVEAPSESARRISLRAPSENRVSTEPMTKMGANLIGSILVDLIAGEVHVEVSLSELKTSDASNRANQAMTTPAPGPELWFWWVTADQQWIPAGPLAVIGGGHFGAVFDLPPSELGVRRGGVTSGNATNEQPQQNFALLSDLINSSASL